MLQSPISPDGTQRLGSNGHEYHHLNEKRPQVRHTLTIGLRRRTLLTLWGCMDRPALHAAGHAATFRVEKPLGPSGSGGSLSR
jgi:hypothetical protein